MKTPTLSLRTLAFVSLSLAGICFSTAAFAAGCDGLGDGGSYARNLSERKGSGGRNTVGSKQKQNLAKLNDQIKQQLNTCKSAVPQMGNSIIGFDRIQNRLEKAINAHNKYTQNADYLCQKYGIIADGYARQAKDMGNEERSVNLPTKQSFEKQAKLDKDAASDYSGLAGISRKNGQEVQSSMPGIGQDKGGKGEDREMTNAISGLTDSMKNQIAFLKKQASQKLAERNRTAGGDAGGELVGGEAIRFKTQADVNKFYTGINRCETALKRLNGQFKNDYGKLAGDLANAKEESENAAQAFDSTGSKLKDSGAKMDQTAQKMGGDEPQAASATPSAPAKDVVSARPAADSRYDDAQQQSLIANGEAKNANGTAYKYNNSSKLGTFTRDGTVYEIWGTKTANSVTPVYARPKK